ncbi:UDP-glucose 4-epimerase GalE [Caenispirillum bisanense]|uniref:UDP-glucose 4-epimerase n=1 Tax=Caenispirillum bisanense TaxID=414052 RepID=A0A286GXL6_9PROT|nr:UDP-glucose 4-epimerase GalE [Caenispirillum bisanense]SOD99926.1 UDP-glucose 4-epimerase/UDP-arabinose 4-epimerase [Caenispirillum bisanense]
MQARAVLVTGGAGYIGSHVCKALAEAGWTPVAYDDLSNGHAWAVQWGPLERGDIRDRDRLRAVVAAYRPEAVLHFAGRIEVGESLLAPFPFYDVNVAGTLTLLDVMAEAGIQALIFSSTAATYGVLHATPAPESHPCDPINPYGRSKLVAERMIADMGAATGMSWTNLRYFNAAGADPEGTIGEAHRHETHLIPLAVQAARGERGAFAVFGTDYPTADGSCIRDFIHVSDLAEAHVLALKRLLDGGASTTFNLGTGTGASVLQVLDSLEAVAGVPVPTEHRDARAGDPPALVGDPSRAMAALSWTPRRSDLTSIIADAWAWHTSAAAQAAVAV